MPRFLLDENVRVELEKLLKSKRLDVKLASRSTGDSSIASISKKEKRVLVTNDWDFCEYSAKEIYGIVWLRIPQNQPDVLIHAFEKMLSECEKYEGRVTTLEPKRWFSSPAVLKFSV